MPSMRSQIADALLARIALVTDFEYKKFDEVRLAAGDFQDYELPAAQIIDLGEVVVHEQRRAKKNWQLAIEIIIGPDQAATPTQKDLWDLMETTERKIFEKPNLGIAGVLHMHLIATSTDLHFMKPWYVGRLEIQVEYYQALVDVC
jgi:hypothetical protein